jgi:hypothetical protein
MNKTANQQTPNTRTSLLIENHTAGVSFASPDAPLFTVTTSYEFRPDQKAAFGTPIPLEQDHA